MTDLKDELSELIDPHKNQLSGVLGLAATVIKVTNRPKFVWVRLLDNPNEAIQAFNDKVSPTYNMPVLISFDGQRYNVDSVDEKRYPNWGTNSAFYAEHGEQHSMLFVNGGGGDIVWVDSQQFLPLLVLPIGETGSSYVHVVNYIYKNSAGDYLWAGSTGTWIPPSTSPTQATIQVVAMRDSDGEIYTQAGSNFAYSVSGTSNLLNYIPTTLPNNNDLALAAIVRTSSISGSMVGWNDVLDLRQFYGGRSWGSGTGGGGISFPASDGKYYVAKDGAWVEMPSGTGGGGISFPISDGNYYVAQDGAWILMPTEATYFTELLDVPNSYAGQYGKVPMVNYTEDGLEFVGITGVGGSGATDVLMVQVFS